jgi:hypothetical protein
MKYDNPQKGVDNLVETYEGYTEEPMLETER